MIDSRWPIRCQQYSFASSLFDEAIRRYWVSLERQYQILIQFSRISKTISQGARKHSYPCRSWTTGVFKTDETFRDVLPLPRCIGSLSFSNEVESVYVRCITIAAIQLSAIWLQMCGSRLFGTIRKYQCLWFSKKIELTSDLCIRNQSK